MAHGYFPDRRDMRFGGNMERANVGKPNVSVNWGGRDVPAMDLRYENYQAPHRVDNTRPRPPIQTGTPNFSGPMQGKSTYPHELQHQGMPRQHPNPRMRGMMEGIGGLQEQAAVDPSDWRTIIKILDAGGDPGTETKAASLGN